LFNEARDTRFLMRYIRAGSVLAVVGFREPGMLPLLRIVLEAIHSLALGLVLLGLWHVDKKASWGFAR
jgi:hypothetical protein